MRNWRWVFWNESRAVEIPDIYRLGLGEILGYEHCRNERRQARWSDDSESEEEVLEANAALEGALEAGVALTAEQAAAYNIAVTGAEKEADDELTAEEAAMYNANLTGAISTEDYKVEPVEGVKYTQEEADAYNAELDGAKHAGDVKE